MPRILLVLVAVLAFASTPPAHAVVPGNDDWEQAADLGDAPVALDATTAEAGRQGDEPSHDGDGGSIWYRLQLDQRRRVVLTTCQDAFDEPFTHIDVYRHAAVISGLAAQEVRSESGYSGLDGCDTYGDQLVFVAEAGQAYDIALTADSAREQGAVHLQLDAPPGNDALVDADTLFLSGAETGRTLASTLEAPAERDHAGLVGLAGSVWYRVTADRSGPVRFATCDTDADTVLALYTGTSHAALQPVGGGANDDAAGCGPDGKGSIITPTLVEGTTYLLAVAGKVGATGRFRLTTSPQHDLFAGARSLGRGWGSLSGVLLEATVEPGEPALPDGTTGSVWYRMVDATPGPFALDTCDPDRLPATVEVFRGSAVHALTPVPVQRTPCPAADRSRVQWDVEPGQTYRVRVSGTTRSDQLYRVVTPPGNDNRAEAFSLFTGSTEVSRDVDTTRATAEAGEPAHAGTAAHRSVWLALNPTQDGAVRLDTCHASTSFDTVLAVYTRRADGGIDPVPGAANDDTADCRGGTGSRVAFDVAGGTRYLVAVDGRAGATGTARVTLAQRPPNDDLARAERLFEGDVATGTTVNATRQAGEPDHGSMAGSVWYSLTPTESGPVRIETCPATGTTVVAYTGTEVGALTRVDGQITGTCATTFPGVAGTRYVIAVAGAGTTFTLRTGPSNDHVELAQSVSDGGWSGDSRRATDQDGEPGPGSASVWFRWTAPADGPVVLDTCSSSTAFDTVLAVYGGGGTIATLGPAVAAADDGCATGTGSRVAFDAVGQRVYRIRVAGKDGSTGTFRLTFSPRNDAFAAADLLGPSTTAGRTTNATREAGEPDHGAGGSVWYQVTPTVDGPLTLDTCDAATAFDTVLAVYAGAAVDALTQVAVDDDGCGAGGRSRLTFQAFAGTTYRVTVAGKTAGAAGAFRLSRPPANDLAAAAQAFTGTTEGGRLALATAEAGEPAHAGRAAAHSVWYRLTAGADGPLTLDTCDGSSEDTRLAVYAGGPTMGSLVPVAADDGACGDDARVTFEAAVGTSYLVAVDGDGGSFRLRRSPGNDQLAAARSFDGTAVFGDTSGATVEAAEPAHGGAGGGQSVWYRWTAPADTQVTLTTCDAGAPDTLLGVYTGTAVGALTPVAANDDGDEAGCGGGRSLVRFKAVAGTSYAFAVDARGAGGPFRLALRRGPANDRLADAAALDGSFAEATGSTLDAGAEAGEPGAATVWYRWVAPAAGDLVASTCATDTAFDTALRLYRTPVALATPATTSDDAAGCGDGTRSRAALAVGAGEVVHVQVGGKGAAAGAFRLRLTFDTAHDVLDPGAAPVLPEAGGTVRGSNVTAGAEPGEPAHAGQPAVNSVWYRLTAPGDATMTLDVCDSDFDTRMAVYQGTGIGDLRLVAANDDSACSGARSMRRAAGSGSMVSFPATAGQTYLVAVDGQGGQTGSYALRTVRSVPAGGSPVPVDPGAGGGGTTDPGPGTGGPGAQGGATGPGAGGGAAQAGELPRPPRLPDGSFAPPQSGVNVNVELVRGSVLVRLPRTGRFLRLADVAQIPFGSEVDTTKGRARIVTSLERVGAPPQAGDKTQSVLVYDGRFLLRQRVKEAPLVEFALSGANFAKACGTVKPRGRTAGAAAQKLKKSNKRVRKLWGDGKGTFRVKARYGASSVRGTVWLTEDRCDGTLVRVKSGVVEVRDLRTGKVRRVRAGQQYLVKA